MSRSWIAIVAVLVMVGAGIALLVTGGGSSAARATDDRGDVSVGEGKNEPKDTSLADLDSAEIRKDGSSILLEVDMVSEIPRRLPDQALAWRWEIYEAGQMTWIVSANVDLGPNASVLATQKDYSFSTVDDRLPGDIEVDGSRLTVTLRADEIDGFPSSFDWLVKTSLDGSRIQARSAIATDQVPDEGFLEVVD